MELLNVKQALKTVKLIAEAGAKLDERIHVVGCSGLAHYQENGDTTALTELAKAMPKSARGNALRYWITKHANVKWNRKAFGGLGGFVKVSKGATIEVSLQEAIDNPFYIKEDKEPAQFNPESRVKSFIGAFYKAMENGEITQDEWNKAKEEILAA